MHPDAVVILPCGTRYEVQPSAAGIFTKEEVGFFVETLRPLCFPSVHDPAVFVVCGAQPESAPLNVGAAALTGKPIRGSVLVCPQKILPLHYMQ